MRINLVSLLAAVQAEQRAQPTIEELIAELPAIVWAE